MKRSVFVLFFLSGALFLAACGKSNQIGAKPRMHPVHGIEVWAAVGPLAGVNTAKANGALEEHCFKDGFCSQIVRLNIYPPKDKGLMYVAWLQDADTNALVKLGKLSNPAGDVRYVLNREDKRDVGSFLRILVSLEKSESITAPGQSVAEGMLKVVPLAQ